MHCPTCREENAPTTRFCTSCGAVLVEEAPGGGRRRVLRPWGLRRSAPPTVSPDFPGDASRDGAPRAAGSPTRAGGPALRVDLWLSGAVVAVLSAAAVLHPGLQASESRPAPLNAESLVAAPAVVTMPMAPVVAETRLASPALVEAARPTASGRKREPPAPGKRIRDPVPAPAIESPAFAPVQEPVVVAAAPPPLVAPMPPRPPADRWQGLRDDLGACTALGLIARATCEQRARLMHCESYWGLVALCPAGRTEYGQ